MKNILAIGLSMGIVSFAMAADSGLKVGEMVSAFHPQHVSGPHKGTDACPPCTYGNRPMVQVWVNGDDMNNVMAVSRMLEKAVETNKKSQFKAFVIVLTDKANTAQTAKMLTAAANKAGFNDLAIAYLPKDSSAIKDYKFNVSPQVKNTVFVYKDRTITAKFVNMNAQNDAKSLQGAIASITR